MSTLNSFAENTNKLIEQVNIALESLVKINESLTTENDTVTISIEQDNMITGDSSIVTYSIPSYNSIRYKVNAFADTLDAFINGTGVVLLNDGTYRRVTVTPVSSPPAKITNVLPPTRFTTKSNWFFESMMFPQLIVSFDLKNKIDDRSDRVVVKRVIFNNYNDEETNWFLDNISNNTNLNYYDLITLLNENGKQYWEDEETQDLPLSTNPYTGNFLISDKRTISGKEWFYFDTMNYGITSDEPIVKDHQLSIGDQLKYQNSIWKIDDIQISEKRVHVIPIVGVNHPTINNSFEIYVEPFSTKILNIPVGYDECNSIFLKGVNDDYNIIANEWSDAISFYSNTLVGSESSITLNDYYTTYVSDFGKQLEGQAKEKFIPASMGLIPNTVIL